MSESPSYLIFLEGEASFVFFLQRFGCHQNKRESERENDTVVKLNDQHGSATVARSFLCDSTMVWRSNDIIDARGVVISVAEATALLYST